MLNVLQTSSQQQVYQNTQEMGWHNSRLNFHSVKYTKQVACTAHHSTINYFTHVVILCKTRILFPRNWSYLLYTCLLVTIDFIVIFH